MLESIFLIMFFHMDNYMLHYLEESQWLQKKNQSCHNGFPLDLERQKINAMESLLIFLFRCDWPPIKGLWSLKTKFGFGSTVTCREGISTPTTPEKMGTFKLNVVFEKCLKNGLKNIRYFFNYLASIYSFFIILCEKYM